MTERIDFALEPGVLLFLVAVFILISFLLAAVLYPYLRRSETAESSSKRDVGEERPSTEAEPPERMTKDFEERVDAFLKEAAREKRRSD